MRLLEQTCAVGEFLVLQKDEKGNLTLSSTSTYRTYDDAESAARRVAAAQVDRRTFIAQLSGEFKCVPSVVEVHKL